MQGRTTCWDLPSLLIKPVQRVLKYPLLLRVSKKTNALLFFVGMLSKLLLYKELLACTPENHPDYEQLLMVTQEIQQMADHINEIKRRKDIVEQLISDKKILDRNVSCSFFYDRTSSVPRLSNLTFLIRLCKAFYQDNPLFH